jgi:iron complex transport system ATP-binding protein
MKKNGSGEGGKSRELLRLKKICFSYDGKRILDSIDFSLIKGDFTGIIGPNGAGKTTLLRCIWGICNPESGSILLSGRPVQSYSLRDRATHMGAVFQEEGDFFEFKVGEVVMMGRYPYLRRFRGETDEDRKAVYRAMEQTDTRQFADRPVTRLSSGERQRVILARALAQEPEILFLDEPTSYLDISHKIQIFEILRTLNLRKNLTVLVISHDLNFAAEYCRKIVLLDRGRIVSEGSPVEIFREDILRSVYGSAVAVIRNPFTDAPNVLVIPGTQSSPS